MNFLACLGKIFCKSLNPWNSSVVVLKISTLHILRAILVHKVMIRKKKTAIHQEHPVWNVWTFHLVFCICKNSKYLKVFENNLYNLLTDYFPYSPFYFVVLKSVRYININFVYYFINFSKQISTFYISVSK